MTSGPDGGAPRTASAEEHPVDIPPVSPDGTLVVPKKRKSPTWRIIQIAFSIVIVVGIFAYAIPKFADYSKVWPYITSMTPLEYASLFAVTLFNLVTYWWQQMAAMPGLG